MGPEGGGRGRIGTLRLMTHPRESGFNLLFEDEDVSFN